MQGFRSPGSPQRFVSIFSALRNLFVPPRIKRSAIHLHRLQAMAAWKTITARRGEHRQICRTSDRGAPEDGDARDRGAPQGRKPLGNNRSARTGRIRSLHHEASPEFSGGACHAAGRSPPCHRRRRDASPDPQAHGHAGRASGRIVRDARRRLGYADSRHALP